MAIYRKATYRSNQKRTDVKLFKDVQTGHVIFVERQYLEQKYPNRKLHDAIIMDFLGLTLRQLRQMTFVGWAFRYSADHCNFIFPKRNKHAHFFRLAFNNLRAFDRMRGFGRLEVEEILKFQNFYYDQTKSYLPRCPATNEIRYPRLGIQRPPYARGVIPKRVYNADFV